MTCTMFMVRIRVGAKELFITPHVVLCRSLELPLISFYFTSKKLDVAVIFFKVVLSNISPGLLKVYPKKFLGH